MRQELGNRRESECMRGERWEVTGVIDGGGEEWCAAVRIADLGLPKHSPTLAATAVASSAASPS